MPYKNVFLINTREGADSYHESYDSAVKRLHELVSADSDMDPSPFISVWKNYVQYEDGRRPSKSWCWREFLMVRHLYVADDKINIR